MILSTLLSCCALLGAQDAPSALPTSDTAKVQSDLELVSLELVPEDEDSGDEGSGDRSIGVGTLLLWRVTIDDPSFDGATLPDPQLGAEWAVVDGPRDVVDGTVPKDARPDLVREWTLMPLGGGTFTTPVLTATLGGQAVAVVPAASVQVLPSLGETEEAPRPLLGFREAPDRRVGDPRVAFLVLLGLLAACVGWFLWRRSVKRRGQQVAPASAEPSAMEQLQSLELNADAPGSTMAALAPLFRRAFDQELSETERLRRSSLTDDAWGQEAAAKGGIGPDAARLLSELSSYRYGGGEPTSFAVKDALKRATELAAELSAGAAAVRPADSASPADKAKGQDDEEAA